jgi:hypothetical protein
VESIIDIGASGRVNGKDASIAKVNAVWFGHDRNIWAGKISQNILFHEAC